MHYSPVGSTGIHVSSICVGTSPLGGMAAIYGYDVEENQAISTLAEVLATESINFIDSSNDYGNGESERRIGAAIREAGGLPNGLVLATKADPSPGNPDFSAKRIRASFLESAERMGVERFDIYYVHDPERVPFEEAVGPGGALEGMLALKDEGLVTTIGVAGWDTALARRYVDTGAIDVVLNHNRYTLLDQSAGPLIDYVRDAGLAFINAAPYSSGILAKPASAKPRFSYVSPSDAITQQTARFRAVCAEYGVDLAAVALQFSTRDPRITSTIVGVSHPDRVRALVANDAVDIPDELWENVDRLIAAARE